MQARVDPAQDRRVRSARAVSQMGLERQDREARRRSHKTCAGPYARDDWTRRGTEGFLGRRMPPGAPVATRVALILMGDWCAAAQPCIENQVRGEFDEQGMQS